MLSYRFILGTTMDTEIELKFFVSPDITTSLTKKLEEYKILQQSSRYLSNTYFDTSDHQLRALDAGLRIRHFDDVYVQTLKTSGRVVAGLHQRPEFNNELDANTPNLSLLPKDVWPENLDIELLSSQIHPLFCTNFTREQWLVSMPDGSKIEVAFDHGEVTADDKQDPICEIELELKSGQVGALFTLARDLSAEGNNMRLGNLSKAARGYRLANNYSVGDVNELPSISYDNSNSVENAFVIILEEALEHWHKNEQHYVESKNPFSLYQISQSVRLIRQTLAVYGGLIPRRASAHIRQELQWIEGEMSWLPEYLNIQDLIADKGSFLKKLDARKQLVNQLNARMELLPNAEDVMNFLTSSRYCSLLLDLSHWLVTKGWQPFLDDKSVKKLAKPIKPFADKVLDKSWDELGSVFTDDLQLSRQVYLDQHTRLTRNLMTGRCFAQLYDDEIRATFRLPWLDILRGIDDLQMLTPLHNLVDEIEDKDERKQLVKWLLRKEEYLLHAIDQTRHIGVELTPYWP